MKMYKYILIVLGILILLFCFWFFYLSHERERRLMKEGYRLVEKIEEFRTMQGRLPISLEEIGVEEKEGYYALFYDVRSECNYTISFGVSIDYNKFYYSDTKTWENGYREME